MSGSITGGPGPDRVHPAHPILVTGVPRSGTTWLARTLASGSGAAMPGREPMNPRGGQYALGGSVSGWVRLTTLTGAQRRRLRAAYRGINPLVYGRYGIRQWSAWLPRTRIVVKDPFAMLSLPQLSAATGAQPVLVFRHPGAVLSSYRRMGWTADLEELRAVLPGDLNGLPDDLDEVSRMGHFWAALNRTALSDLEGLPRALVVSHQALVRGGDTATRRLFGLCGLATAPGDQAPPPTTESAGAPDHPGVGRPDSGALHRFDRSAGELTGGWRSTVSDDELHRLEDIAGRVLADLERRAVQLS